MANTKITNPELFNLGDSTSATQLPVMTTIERIAMNAAPTFNIDYLVVAGGGGGGMGYYGGGGGAGGLLTNVGGTSLVLAAGGSGYTITVGDGGSGAASKTVNGTNGSNSRFNAIEAYGGGGAASRDTTGGSSGGSGGGAANPNAVGGSGTVGQGNDGGTLTGQRYGSGGGGANQAGQIPPQTYSQTPQNYSIGAPGGNGLEVNITGVDTFYAGGGGGGARATYSPNGINGGLGGGGAGGAVLPGSNGIDELGGGGGGGGFDNDSGGSGGSGIVILRYPTADIASYTATGLTPTETTDGTDTVLSFTTVGTGTISFTSSTPTGTISTGEMIFNSTTDKVEYWDGTKWYGITYEVIYPTSLNMFLKAGNTTSYPGTGTTWFDLTSNANNGVISGASFSSLDGGYFSFDGSNDFVNTGSSTTKALPMSVEMWINPGSSFSPRGIIYSNYDSGTINGFFIRLETSGKFQIDCYYKPAGTYYRTLLNQTGSALPINQWSQCIFTFDTSYVKSYLNGVLDAQVGTNSQGIGFTSSFDTLLASRAGGDYFSGKISQARVYDVTLTQAEITALHLEGR